MIKKILTSLLLSTLLIMGALATQSAITHAQSTPVAKPTDTLKIIQGELTKRKVNLPTYESQTHPKASTVAGVSNITSALYYVIEFVKYALGSVAVFLIVISGVKLVLATDKIDETSQKEKNHLTYSVIGLVVIIIADQAVKKVFFGETGDVLSSTATAQEYALRGTDLIRSIYRVIQTVLGTLAVMVFVISGLQYALSGGKEDTTSKAKRRITWGIVGIMIVGLSELIVFDIVFPEAGKELPRTLRLSQLVVSITNFASAFIASLAILGFIYAGYMYVTVGIKEDHTDKAKKAIFASIAGIILAAAAYAIVNTLLGGLTAPA